MKKERWVGKRGKKGKKRKRSFENYKEIGRKKAIKNC